MGPYFDHGLRRTEPADTVLQHYMLNVVESPEERDQALHAAWRLTRGRRSVAARLTWVARRAKTEDSHQPQRNLVHGVSVYRVGSTLWQRKLPTLRCRLGRQQPGHHRRTNCTQDDGLGL